MDESKKQKMYRDLVTVAVEHALITMGGPELERVQFRLKQDYNITIGDSLDHPEYLKNVLCDLFGNAYQDIVDAIYSVVDNAKEQKLIKDFLYVMEH